MKYTTGSYNKANEYEQWIRITDGCPNNCEYCYAPTKLEFYGIPEIVRNNVKIMDMNPLSIESRLTTFLHLLPTKLNKRVIHYEMICGFDYRYMNEATAEILHKLRFGRFNRKGKWQRGVRIAWDLGYNKKLDIIRVINMFLKAGFKPKQIEVFILCDWKIKPYEVWQKMEEVHDLGCMVNDCWFDNVKPPNYQCNYWTFNQCKIIRAISRKLNHLIIFNGYDPENKSRGVEW